MRGSHMIMVAPKTPIAMTEGSITVSGIIDAASPSEARGA
jgi:hypothetical protein